MFTERCVPPLNHYATPIIADRRCTRYVCVCHPPPRHHTTPNSNTTNMATSPTTITHHTHTHARPHTHTAATRTMPPTTPHPPNSSSIIDLSYSDGHFYRLFIIFSCTHTPPPPPPPHHQPRYCYRSEILAHHPPRHENDFCRPLHGCCHHHHVMMDVIVVADQNQGQPMRSPTIFFFLRASKIMVERAQSNPKIKFLYNTVIEEAIGGHTLERLRLRNVESGERSESPRRRVVRSDRSRSQHHDLPRPARARRARLHRFERRRVHERPQRVRRGRRVGHALPSGDHRRGDGLPRRPGGGEILEAHPVLEAQAVASSRT